MLSRRRDCAPPLEQLSLRGGPQPLALGVHLQPLGDVPDRGDHHRSLLGGQPAQPDLGGERAAIRAARTP